MTSKQMAQKRWAGVSAEERSKLMSQAVASRWDSATEEERATVGKRLAAARRKARNRKIDKK